MQANTWDPQVIVVGIDGSQQARHATSLAASLARKTGAEIHLVTVVRPPEGWWGIVGSPPTSTALGNTLTDAKQQILDMVAEEVDLTDIDYQLVEEIGDPAKTLVNYATSIGADLLVVGKRGAGIIERMMIGSVANRVVHDAQCPVIVVP